MKPVRFLIIAGPESLLSNSQHYADYLNKLGVTLGFRKSRFTDQSFLRLHVRFGPFLLAVDLKKNACMGYPEVNSSVLCTQPFIRAEKRHEVS